MKLSTRMKISYVSIFLLPILLILAMVFGFMKFGLASLEKKYDLDSASYNMILDPTSIYDHMSATSLANLRYNAENDPDKMADREYLDFISQELGGYSSYLVIRRNFQDIYCSVPEITDTQAYEQYAAISVDGLYNIGDELYRVECIYFAFTDGAPGQILVYTNVQQIMPQIQRYLLRMVIVGVLILFIVSAVVMMGLYKSIVGPIHNLKAAAENITAGNLNYSITAQTDDEIGELCKAFEEMRLKLKSQIEYNIQSEKESKELISNISHDLKTPMTSIKGYIEGIMDGVADTPEKQERYIRTIYNKVNDMNSLIEELFLYAKLDSNSVNYSFMKVNLDGYFQDCVDEISLDLEAQGVKFSFYNYSDRSTVIIADPEQLKRVINNIIGNSVKYAASGRQLAINIRIIEEEEFVKIEIEDNGKGIAKSEIPFIFDRLYRTDASRNSSKGGSGLGLSIAKKIIEEHGGKIWATSTEGVGTTMCFVIRKYKENGIYE